MADYERKRIREQQRTNAVIGEIVQALQPLLESAGLRQMQQLADLMARLAYPPRFEERMGPDEMQMELLRTFEIHGDGLRPFSHGHLATPGEVLVGSDRSVWIVSAVDEDGQITETVGATTSRKAREIAFVWRAEPSPRRWLAPDQLPAPAYRNIEQALTHIVRTWGESWHDGRNLAEPAGLLLALLAAPGLRMRAGTLTEDADDETMLTFMHDRGGTIAVGPGIAAPGDVVRLNAERRWGVIIRAHAAEADILVGGGKRAGALGEPRDAVQMRRDQQLTPADLIWKPQTRVGSG